MMKSLIKRLHTYTLTKQIAIISIIVSIVTVGIACYFTYYSVKKSAIKNSIKQVSETVRQLEDKLNDNILQIYDIYSRLETNRAFVDIAGRDDGEFRLNHFSTLSELFNDTHILNTKIIDSIIFIRDDGQVFYEYQQGINKSIDYRNLDWYKKTEKNNGFAIWYPPYSNEMFTGSRNETVALMKMITDNSYQRKGILVININISFFKDELEKVYIGNDSKLFIVDSDGNLIASAKNNEQECIVLVQKLNKKEEVSDVMYQDNKRSYIINRDIGKTNWQVVSIIPENELIGETNILYLWILTAIFTGGVTTFVLMLFVLKKITIPLTKLTHIIQRTDNETGKQLRCEGKELERKDEIGYLAQSYNVMIDNIENLMETIKVKSEEEAKAQLRALQQQINSHFLYNTLDTIYWKVMSGEKKEGADMVKRLSTYFRLALNRGDDITTVANEIKHIENYVEIERYRYNNKITCKINVDERIYDFKVPKLLIQPLVENAVIHGLFAVKSDALISVEGKMDGDKIVFTVEDNGTGMDIQAVNNYVLYNQKTELLKNSFALRNSYTRIRLYYKEEGDMKFYINKMGGVGVRIVLPRKEQK